MTTRLLLHGALYAPSAVVVSLMLGRYWQDQWSIGQSSMLAGALGLAPFKVTVSNFVVLGSWCECDMRLSVQDTFWTTSVQPGAPFVVVGRAVAL